MGVSLFLLITGCSDIIAIERLPTPTTSPSPTPDPIDGEALAGLGIPTRIFAETIALDATVVEMGWRLETQRGQAVSVWDIPENEAAWHHDSAWPGQGSNVVISGHNASLGGQIFSEVEELEVGDQVVVWNGRDEAFAYQVQERTIVRTFAASSETQTFLETAMGPTPEERLTLITCWPRWTNTHRLVVVAEPVGLGEVNPSKLDINDDSTPSQALPARGRRLLPPSRASSFYFFE